ncbi:PilZ domain-containing protein [Azohydromonas aeria]|uniref:PilZ domain-containing protein n=1 Tax=Azohydromonas aeria TaxID=2590212 RepID=UPI0012F8A29E|nr:PilZ domain-containing protein [Azohydromonas aeria]
MSASTDFASHVQSGVAARRHPRARFASTVHLRLPGGRLVEARTQDISLGGLQLVVPGSIAPGTPCDVRLLVPAIPFGVRTVTAQVEVVSLVFSGKAGGFVIGLRFTSIPEASTAALQAYLQERSAHKAFGGGSGAAVRPPAPALQPAQPAAEPPSGVETGSGDESVNETSHDSGPGTAPAAQAAA